MRRAPLAVLLLFAAAAACWRSHPATIEDAARSGSASDVEAILARDPAALEHTSSGGRTPVAIAARAGNVDALRALLRHHPVVDHADDHGRTALHEAAEAGRLDAIDELIDARAASSLEDAEGRTALHLALGANQTEAADRLRFATPRPTPRPVSTWFGAAPSFVRPLGAAKWSDDPETGASILPVRGGAVPADFLSLPPGAGEVTLHFRSEARILVVTSGLSFAGAPAAPGVVLSVVPPAEGRFRCEGSDRCLLFRKRDPADASTGKGSIERRALTGWFSATEPDGRLETYGPGPASNMHTHELEHYTVVFRGTWYYDLDSGREEMPVGTYGYISFGSRHAAGCVSKDGCTVFYVQSK